MDVNSLASFFEVFGFMGCVICFSVGAWIVGTCAWLGVQAMDARLSAMKERIAIFRQKELNR